MKTTNRLFGPLLTWGRPLGSSRSAALAALALALLGSALPASAASLVLTTNAPTPGPNDIYSFAAGASDNNNVNSGADAATYVAADQTTKGQTFTVGSSAGGYLLSDIWVRHCGYTGSVIGNGTWWNMGNGAVITLRVTDPTKVGQAGFALSSETYTATGTENAGARWTGGNNSLGDDMWLHFTLGTPVSLAANTQYGIELTATTAGGGNYFEWLGTSNNAYSGGVAYSGITPATVANTMQTNIGDRVFLVQLGSNVPPVTPTLSSALAYVATGQVVQVAATIPAIANQGRAVALVLTNNNPGLISLPAGASTITLNFAANATNVQTFNVTVLANGVGRISVVPNAAFLAASISIGTPVTAREQFEYDPSIQTTLDQANGGSGFSAPWSQPTLVDYLGAGLDYIVDTTSLVTSSNAAYVTGTGNEAFRALPGTYGGVGGGTVWISFLAQAPSGVTDWGGLSLFSGTNSENLFMGEVRAQSAGNTWGFSQGGNYNMNFAGSLTPGAQVDLLAYRIDFPATNGGRALVSFYADPRMNTNAPFSPIGSAYVDNFTFDTIRLGTSDGIVFDEIRVGSKWTDVMQFSGPAQPLVPPSPELYMATRKAPVGYTSQVRVTIPASSPRPVNMNFVNDNPACLSLSSSTLTFPVGGTNVQMLNVRGIL